MSETPDLEARVELLEAKVAGFEKFFRDLGQQAQPPPPVQPAEPGSEPAASGEWVAVGDRLRILAEEGDDPKAIAQAIQDAIDRADGKLPWPQRPAAS